MAAAQVQVKIDLDVVRARARAILAATGVDLIAVVKSNAYGLGTEQIVQTLRSSVNGWCVFNPDEAREVARLDPAGKPILVLGPSAKEDPESLARQDIHPAVWTEAQAARMKPAKPVLCLDTGMRRFACPPEQIDRVIAAGQITEAFTHATRIEHVRQLRSTAGGRGLRLHAAASALLENREAFLDAVRPGMALYRGAVRISCPLVETFHGGGPAGYSGFNAEHFGVIICGYSQGLRAGPCLVNGARRGIIEVGMQTAFVEIGPSDRVGDEVVLLGDGITEAQIAAAWNTSEQLVLKTLTNAAQAVYLNC